MQVHRGIDQLHENRLLSLFNHLYSGNTALSGLVLLRNALIIRCKQCADVSNPNVGRSEIIYYQPQEALSIAMLAIQQERGTTVLDLSYPI